MASLQTHHDTVLCCTPSLPNQAHGPYQRHWYQPCPTRSSATQQVSPLWSPRRQPSRLHLSFPCIHHLIRCMASNIHYPPTHLFGPIPYICPPLPGPVGPTSLLHHPYPLPSTDSPHCRALSNDPRHLSFSMGPLLTPPHFVPTIYMDKRPTFPDHLVQQSLQSDLASPPRLLDSPK